MYVIRRVECYYSLTLCSQLCNKTWQQTYGLINFVLVITNQPTPKPYGLQNNFPNIKQIHTTPTYGVNENNSKDFLRSFLGLQ